MIPLSRSPNCVLVLKIVCVGRLRQFWFAYDAFRRISAFSKIGVVSFQHPGMDLLIYWCKQQFWAGGVQANHVGERAAFFGCCTCQYHIRVHVDGYVVQRAPATVVRPYMFFSVIPNIGRQDVAGAAARVPSLPRRHQHRP